MLVTRFSTNPLITAASSPTLGDNINGPSVIRVPDWLPNPLGRYYLYFAHHQGQFIRLAYADDLQGPWCIHDPGTLQLKDASAFQDHIASPDVHVDHQAQKIRMYFHGVAKARPGQWTGVATSRNGIDFTASEALLGKFYFRVWSHGDAWYALAKNHNAGWGELYRAEEPMGPFRLRGDFLQGMRHAAVLVREDELHIYYTQVGDEPERILRAKVDLRPDWKKWNVGSPQEVLKPEKDYEGADYPIAPSQHGPATKVCELRDPFVLLDEQETVIFYAGAGEEGLCAALLQDEHL
ncbi:hypothetical protein Thiowin_00105 [Thiorhodovibrio winogradskyi]|uniref:Uncharacterized protein n=1 Tax=Thiorhodovibrio winogradskyi TaxID=77007 RepID=A0ABZ0S4D6_9GAMM|nr:hypothetical protein [Thiorhodovibrio winogradskyi]